MARKRKYAELTARLIVRETRIPDPEGRVHNVVAILPSNWKPLSQDAA